MVVEQLCGSRPRGEAPPKKGKGGDGGGKSKAASGKERSKGAFATKKGGDGKGLHKSQSFERRRRLKYKSGADSGRSAQSGDEEEDEKPQKDGVDEEEAHLAETHDNRFVHLRAQLSAALLRSQREISQTRCEVCSHQLRHPFRLLGCRHLVCALCAESTVRYWDECPVCDNTTSHAREDVLHAMVLKQREEDYWRNSRDTRPVGQREGASQDAAWQSRLEIALKERERSCRAVLHFGCDVDPPKNDRIRITWFLHLVNGECSRGAKCDIDPGVHIFDRVTIHHSPSATNPLNADEMTVARPTDAKLGYALSLETKQRGSPRGDAVCCDLTVHWAAELGLAPLEIKGVAPANQLPNFRKWIVVQLPMQQGRATLKSAAPIVYGDGLKPQPSGWVCYQSGKEARVYVGARSFGRAAPGEKRAEATGHNKPALGKSTPASSPRSEGEHADKLLTLAPLKQHALGRLADVQRELAIAASAGVPLAEVSQRVGEVAAMEAKILGMSLDASKPEASKRRGSLGDRRGSLQGDK
eukprot:5851090-Prymnesium_polylepis.1